jgi:hypothetical protein
MDACVAERELIWPVRGEIVRGEEFEYHHSESLSRRSSGGRRGGRRLRRDGLVFG